MTKSIAFLLLIPVFVFCHSSDFFAGMSFAGFGENIFFDTASEAALESLFAHNANWVGICVWWFQDDCTSSTFQPEDWGTPSDSSLRHLIEYAHELGFSVMLKPMVDPEHCAGGSTWRALINPTSWETWFETYRNFIGHYASIAEELDVELFCIGCELISSSTTRQDDWLSVVDTVRETYSGPIIYAANWWGEYDLISWWSALDYIGIDAYFPLSDHGNPTMEELIAGWAPHIEAINEFLSVAGLSHDIIFTEIGCGSYTGASTQPWNYDFSDCEPNQLEQANYYESFFQAVLPQPWMRGIFWWWWDNKSTGDFRYDPDYGPNYACGFTPNGKLAGQVLRERYGEIVRTNEIDHGERMSIKILPNPSRNQVRFLFEHSQNSEILLEIFDIIGHRLVCQRFVHEQGTYLFEWNGLDSTGKDVWSGVFFAKISGQEFAPIIRRFIFLR